jgi:hypothetical protein
MQSAFTCPVSAYDLNTQVIRNNGSPKDAISVAASQAFFL